MHGECRTIGHGGDCGEVSAHTTFKEDSHFSILLDYFHMGMQTQCHQSSDFFQVNLKAQNFILTIPFFNVGNDFNQIKFCAHATKLIYCTSLWLSSLYPLYQSLLRNRHVNKRVCIY